MKRTTAITLLYTGVVFFSAIVIGGGFLVRSLEKRKRLANAPLVVNSGAARPDVFFKIGKDFLATNQDKHQVKLSDLRGKVWIAAEFFAVCPRCMTRNGAELRSIYDQFRNNPDFHIACISVDPENDSPAKLGDYAKALGAETKNWWFLNGGATKPTHDYLTNELKFFSIRERLDDLDIQANGRYDHDLSLMLINRDFEVVGKWPLASARSDEAMKNDPTQYERIKDELYTRIRAELAKPKALKSNE